MQIKETYDNIKNFVLSVVNSHAFLKLVSAAVVITSIVPRAAFAITACALRLFNKMDLAARVDYVDRKFTIIVTEHFKANLAEAPLPLLASSKNLPTRTVIINEEDKTAINTMRTLFLQKFPHLDSKKKVEEAKNRGASFKLADSMCLGGCLRAIATCHSAKSQDELVALCKPFEAGFDADAAAVQFLYRKAFHACKDAHVSDAELYKSFGELMKLKTQPNLSQVFDFYDILGERSAGAEESFNALPTGAYLITFTEAHQKGHAVVLFKYEFGTCLFDPEYGLMSTQDHTQAQALITLIESYQKLSLRCQSFRFAV